MPDEKIPDPQKAEPKKPADDAPADTKPASELTPEEQMERFEKALKEDDWGHQPC